MRCLWNRCNVSADSSWMPALCRAGICRFQVALRKNISCDVCRTYIAAIHVHHVIKFLFPSLALEPPLLNITSGSSWLYVNWNAQSATFRVLYRKSGAPDYQVIVPTTSQLSHNISALQPNTLYNIVLEATHTVTQLKVNGSVTRTYTTPRGELKGVRKCSVLFTL